MHTVNLNSQRMPNTKITDRLKSYFKLVSLRKGRWEKGKGKNRRLRQKWTVYFITDTVRIACGLCNGTVSVPPYVCLSVRPSLSYLSTAAAACGGFAAACPACSRYRSIAARRVCSRRGRHSIHIHSNTAVSSKCEQCHVVSWRRKLNTCVL